MEDVEPIVAVLAGGAGSRLEGAKPGALLAGKPLISYPLAAAQAAGLEVVVVAKPETDLPPLEVEVIRETDPLRHPLTGVLAALDAVRPRAVVALACDMPFVSADLLRAFAAASGDTVVETDRGPQPLLARYEASSASRIRTALCRGEPAVAASLALEPRMLAGDELAALCDPATVAFNVNAPADVAEAERLLAST